MHVTGEINVVRILGPSTKAVLCGIIVGDVLRVEQRPEGFAAEVKWDYDTFAGVSAIYVYDSNGRPDGEHSGERTVTPGQAAVETLRYWCQSHGLTKADILPCEGELPRLWEEYGGKDS